MNYDILLGRKPFRLDYQKDLEYLKGKRILITGAGGSIGSELSQQMIFGLADRLYLFDHSENNVYEINRKLLEIQKCQDFSLKTHIEPIVGEIQDTDYVNFLIERLKVDIVFHTAAHKHVELCERNPVEAVKNNVFGTQNIINACKKFKVDKFILISSDKALEPTSIYGATKFLGEELVLREKDSHKFLIVRFGNVIGSKGSVVPLFKEQITIKGGPVTITDKRAKRYFMTIHEAVSLVIKVGEVGKGGNLYILDMGEQIYIEELAKKLINHYHDHNECYKEQIEFVYTGLRDGEKLEEKLWDDTEKVENTDHPKILQARKTIQKDINGVLKDLKAVCFFDHSFPEFYRDKVKLREAINKVIPTVTVGNERRY